MEVQRLESFCSKGGGFLFVGSVEVVISVKDNNEFKDNNDSDEPDASTAPAQRSYF